MSKKIMILGASILQLPAIEKAKEMGYEVIAVDMNPKAVGFEVPGVIKEVISTIDSLFELSINNKYHEIMEKIEKESSNSIKAYYYFLIKDTEELSSIMNDLKEEYESLNYQDLSNHKCYNLAIYEFNKTCRRSLAYLSNEKDDIDKLNLLLQQAAARYWK